VSNFTVMGEHAGLPPKPIEPEPTSASICYTDEGLQVDWKAVDKHVVYNCSGSYTECCHDKVWMRDALEFYIAPGLNASWDPSVGDFGAHNVTEVDGGPMGGLWAGYMNNSGYNPTQPSILIDCSVPGLSWKPRITSDGFAAHLRVPWHMLPGGKPEVLKGSVWRLNFYRWDHGLDPHDVTVGNASAWSVTYCDFGEKGDPSRPFLVHTAPDANQRINWKARTERAATRALEWPICLVLCVGAALSDARRWPQGAHTQVLWRGRAAVRPRLCDWLCWRDR